MKRRIGISVFFLGGVLFFAGLFLTRGEERVYAEGNALKKASVVVDGAVFDCGEGVWETVGNLLADSAVEISEGDEVFPDPDSSVSSGIRVSVMRKKSFSVSVDGSIVVMDTFSRTVGEALEEAGIRIGEDDIVQPDRTTPLSRETEATVIRVEIREETVEKLISYGTVEKKDADLSWRKRTVTRKGENGIREYRYRVSYHDGEEVARKLLENEVTKDPIDEIVTQGTHVKTGTSHTGGASWYAHTGTMSAANPWLPIGSYVRVTNKANGKSVIVRINDRGPFVAGRIIDLDKVAFEEIASLGAGVIDVKMEEITN